MNNNKKYSARGLRDQIAGSRERLYRVAYAWCADEMLADDLVQETMKTGIAKIHQLQDEHRLYAWLYSIMRHTWHQHMRKDKPTMELDEQLPCEEYDPLDSCQEIEMIEHVQRAVATLSVEQREVIALVDLEELAYCEVAEVLGIPIGTVMSRLHRARKSLLNNFDNPARDYIRIVK